MIHYCSKENVVIPLHANVFFNAPFSEDRDLFTGLLDLRIVDALLRFIDLKGLSFEYYIDFDRIDKVDSRVLLKLCGLSGFKIFLYNVGDGIEEQVSSELSGTLIKLSIDDVMLQKVNETKTAYLEDIVNDETKEENPKYYLDSSNVYLNKYVNIKSLFNKPNSIKLLIYELCNVILEKYYDSTTIDFQFDCIVSSSFTGSSIATCLSYIVNKPAIHFHNIGPKYAIHNAQVQKKIIRGSKYLFVYDFICLGTEYRLTKNIIESNLGAFVGGVGVSSYAKPTTKISLLKNGVRVFEDKPVFEINSLVYVDSTKFDYKIDTRIEVQSNE